ncbi:hypothetical protein OG2516_00010 [Oceanicola granulosus HTCC2516]|uniref:Uncharacterized protein n=1 Tax=Oceanicola granulosus (strain ATCC BAA-861 / DSM 15982 / KCTC 12143 / HTCC2516) TaxID=314256 RepID=Q2CDY9_OCEGH|nr:hypothetical protein [Oceanicola granulosus]EAR50839.1 hypothetical protein OG2516_00010 [Oceanicola granulosus HTCC2516]
MGEAKIATCCYCGTRAALVLKGQGRHELACATCGAPLHDMKRLRADVPHPAPPKPGPPRPKPGGWKGRKVKKIKKKSLKRKVFGEVFDMIEDLFD